MLIGVRSEGAAAGGALDKPELEKVGLIEFLNRRFFFGKRGRQSAEADRPATEFVRHHFEKLPVGGRKTFFIDAKEFEGEIDGFGIERPARLLG